MPEAVRGRPPDIAISPHPAVRGLLVAAIAAVIVSFSRCSPDYEKIANLDSPRSVIVCFGDSITAGYGLRPEQAFPALIAKRLGMPVVNAGVYGHNTVDTQARIYRDVLEHNPRLVFVEFGGNDFRRKVGKQETFANLDRVVGRLVEHGAIVVVLEMRIGLFRDEYLAGYKKVVRAHGALLIPNFMSKILGNHKLTVDGLHPNAAGHELIAGRVMETLVPLLAEADRARAGKRQAP